MPNVDRETFFNSTELTREALDNSGFINTQNEIALIRLQGFPYEQVIDGEMISCTDTLHALATSANYRENLFQKIEEHEQELTILFEEGYDGLDKAVKSPEPLSYEKAFAAITYITFASNAALYEQLAPKTKGYNEGQLNSELVRLRSISLLQALSTRESLIGLQPQEIAGMISAVIELDTVARASSEDGISLFALGGMGGDRGIPTISGNSKLFSVSTLSALALGEVGRVHKHHSYPNTSRIAGQSAIEALGARSDFSSTDEMEMVLEASNILMTSCHNTRPLHSISHLLKRETINHAIGPGAFPQNALNELHALIGVNHNVHPETFIETLRILDQRKVQHYGNSVAFCCIDEPIDNIPTEVFSTDKYYRQQGLKSLVAMDEVAVPPYTTMAAFLVDGENKGTYLIDATDFMDVTFAEEIARDGLLIENEESIILQANAVVLSGTDEMKVRYAAMTPALALFTRDYASLPDAFDTVTRRVNANYLQACYQQAYAILQSGSVEKRKNLYVEATREKELLPNVDLVILDIDGTLLIPQDPKYYLQYGDAVNRAVASHLGVSFERGTEIANYYRNEFGGGEQGLLLGRIGEDFPEFGQVDPDVVTLYEEMARINHIGQFDPKRHQKQVKLVKRLRAAGKTVVALTDSPEVLSRATLTEAGFDPDTDFNLYLPYTTNYGPLKLLKREEIFFRIASFFGVAHERVLSVGDSFKGEIAPAEKSGIKTCHIAIDRRDGYTGAVAQSILDLNTAYYQAYRN